MTERPTEQDALAMAGIITGALTYAVDEAFKRMDWLTQPTRIEAVDPTGVVKFRLASGMLVTVTVEVERAAEISRTVRVTAASGPEPIDHGWLARSYDGQVDEVWVYGGGGRWVGVNQEGRIVMQGSEWVPEYLAQTRAAAIERVLEAADRLRGELARTLIE